VSERHETTAIGNIRGHPRRKYESYVFLNYESTTFITFCMLLTLSATDTRGLCFYIMHVFICLHIIHMSIYLMTIECEVLPSRLQGSKSSTLRLGTVSEISLQLATLLARQHSYTCSAEIIPYLRTQSPQLATLLARQHSYMCSAEIIPYLRTQSPQLATLLARQHSYTCSAEIIPYLR
jgi:hypothetical protein